MVRLHINVDHVATLRQARGTPYPDPVEAARVCEEAGADGITVHLREDRRHIQDADVRALRECLRTVLNLEMAATDEMVAIASVIRPDKVTLVPEKREERTTEGGLDAVGQRDALLRVVRRLGEAGVGVSLFIDPEPVQVRAAVEVGAREVELHTGDYAGAADAASAARELDRLSDAAVEAAAHPGLGLAAGHGLTVANVPALVQRLANLVELNIGHAVVADAIVIGMRAAVLAFREAIERGVAARGIP